MSPSIRCSQRAEALRRDGQTVMFVVAYAFFYFLSAFALIVLVLNRARGEVASLEDFNRRLVDGLGEGLELVDDAFIIRHANSWMVHQFGPVVGRHCYEVLSAVGRQCPGCPIASRCSMDAPVHLEIDGPQGRRLLLTCRSRRDRIWRIFSSSTMSRQRA